MVRSGDLCFVSGAGAVSASAGLDWAQSLPQTKGSPCPSPALAVSLQQVGGQGLEGGTGQTHRLWGSLREEDPCPSQWQLEDSQAQATLI